MSPYMCFINFSQPLSDPVKETLLEAAYIMLSERRKTKKVRGSCCEGVVKTTFQPLSLYGMNGLQFNAHLEVPQGTLDVSYLLREEELRELTRDADDSPFVENRDTQDEKDPRANRRLAYNPLGKVRHVFRNN
jgi:hypothetical protein